MKIALDELGPYRGLKRHFELEGDQVVPGVNGELVIKPPTTVFAQVVGFEQVEEKPQYIITRWWSNNEWLPQVFVGIPVIGMMNENKGAEVPVGLIGRYTSPSKFEQFDQPLLRDFLKETTHHGFVTFTMSWNGVVELQTGVPFWGLYAILEGVRGKLSQWWSCPTRLYEEWQASLLVSRYPYPCVQRTEGVSLQGVEGGVEEHVWMLGGRKFKDTFVIEDTEVCVVTGAGSHQKEVGFQVRRLCDEIRLNGIQYRTDLETVARDGWAMLREKALV